MSKKFSKKNKSKKLSDKELSVTSSVYNGPIITRSDREQTDTYTITLHNTFTLSSNAGSSIDLIVSADATSVVDWTNYSAAWSEYRVLGTRVEYFPNNRYSKTTVVCKPIITVLDRAISTINTALTSYSVAMAFESAKKHSLEDPWSREIKMRGIEDAGFTDMATNAVPFALKTFADNLSASTEYGRIFIYLRIQFRGRK